MSLRAMSWAWEVKVNAIDKVILLALADCADDDGLCFPSLKTICQKSGVPNSTLCRRLSAMDGTLVTRTRRTYGEVSGDGTPSGGPVATLYRLHLSPRGNVSPTTGVSPSIESYNPNHIPSKSRQKRKPKTERKWTFTDDQLSGKESVEISSARSAIAFWLDSSQKYIDMAQQDDLPSTAVLGGEGRKQAIIGLWKQYPVKYPDIVRAYCTDATRQRLMDQNKGQYFLGPLNVKYEAPLILQQLKSETPQGETLSAKRSRELREEQAKMKAQAEIERKKVADGELPQIVNPFDRSGTPKEGE